MQWLSDEIKKHWVRIFGRFLLLFLLKIAKAFIRGLTWKGIEVSLGTSWDMGNGFWYKVNLNNRQGKIISTEIIIIIEYAYWWLRGSKTLTPGNFYIMNVRPRKDAIFWWNLQNLNLDIEFPWEETFWGWQLQQQRGMILKFNQIYQ